MSPFPEDPGPKKAQATADQRVPPPEEPHRTLGLAAEMSAVKEMTDSHEAQATPPFSPAHTRRLDSKAPHISPNTWVRTRGDDFVSQMISALEPSGDLPRGTPTEQGSQNSTPGGEARRLRLTRKGPPRLRITVVPDAPRPWPFAFTPGSRELQPDEVLLVDDVFDRDGGGTRIK